jgi:hypothetical protein
LLIMKDARFVTALRSSRLDPSRAGPGRVWSGDWGAPAASLFASVFAGDNPYLAPLDAAYRDLEAAMRPYSCTGCHSPDNKAGMAELEILVFPGQALVARHTIAAEVAAGRMPPPASVPAGTVVDRTVLDAAARRFAEMGDAALQAAGEQL